MEQARIRAYGSSRPDVLRLLPPGSGPVLDVGCSTGQVGAAIKARQPGRTVWGIEIDEAAAREATRRLDNVITGDAFESLRVLRTEGFSPEIVLFADTLEHLVDPWAAFDAAVDLLEPGGFVIVSIPNVAHWDTFWNLLRGRWPYRSRGIHDDTHLRFFGRKNVVDLMNQPPVRLVRLRRVLRLLERPHPVNRLAPVLCRAWPGPFTYQYLAVGRVERCAEGSG